MHTLQLLTPLQMPGYAHPSSSRVISKSMPARTSFPRGPVRHYRPALLPSWTLGEERRGRGAAGYGRSRGSAVNDCATSGDGRHQAMNRDECIGLGYIWVRYTNTLARGKCLQQTSHSTLLDQDTPGPAWPGRHWMELTIDLPLLQWHTYDLRSRLFPIEAIEDLFSLAQR